MTYPKMIFFDYGHTLLCEPDFSMLRGEEAILKYVVRNPRALTAMELNERAQALTAAMQTVRKSGFELQTRQYQRLLYESLGIELSISYDDAERVFWEAASPGARMPGAAEILDELNARSIRSGVISNLMFSGAALKERIDRLLPNNHFEFIIASSEYGVRKPSRLLFEIALSKSNLAPSQVWHIGDNTRADVEGAAGAGIFPVWYDDRTMSDSFPPASSAEPSCAHAHIRNWRELTSLLDAAEKA